MAHNPITRKTQKERNSLYKKITKDVEAIVKAHGLNEARWAMTKWLNEYRERQRIEKQKAELEAELAELERK